MAAQSNLPTEAATAGSVDYTAVPPPTQEAVAGTEAGVAFAWGPNDGTGEDLTTVADWLATAVVDFPTGTNSPTGFSSNADGVTASGLQTPMDEVQQALEAEFVLLNAASPHEIASQSALISDAEAKEWMDRFAALPIAGFTQAASPCESEVRRLAGYRTAIAVLSGAAIECRLAYTLEGNIIPPAGSSSLSRNILQAYMIAVARLMTDGYRTITLCTHSSVA